MKQATLLSEQGLRIKFLRGLAEVDRHEVVYRTGKRSNACDTCITLMQRHMHQTYACVNVDAAIREREKESVRARLDAVRT